jgi:NAD(P)-dependent dehydrogenase (short-subunit alcohol dehydrogenase family)
MELRFDGKVALITGAGGGLGRAYALELARRGAQVVVNDLAVPIGAATPPSSRLVADEICDLGGDAIADQHDVLDGAGLVAGAVHAYGRLDIVINNAGVAGGGPLDSGDPAAWERTIATTLHGSIAVTRAAWPHLAAAGSGRVVMTSSGASFGSAGSGAYSAAKASMIGLTRSLATEGRPHGIAVNAIMPAAWTRLTQLLPPSRLSAVLDERYPPEAVAAFVLWLCHHDTAVTAETFSVGAGRAARVVLAEARGGLVSDHTPEAWAAVADAVLDLTDAGYPVDMNDEVRWQLAHLGDGRPARR